ncbi:MAG: rubrerythrin family protein [bacterium]|nr:MAG: rubrerythrin family protein [bacterium]
MSKSEKNLAEAFAGESQANRKYLAFAKKADEEGFPQVARLFRAAAAAETVHAHAHFKVLGGIGDTASNLQEAIGGETHEFMNMYPQMIEEAKAEGNKEAQMSFMYANAVEKIHAELYKKALDAMEGLAETAYFVCDVCGNTVEGEAPERCPVCGMDKSHFMKID